jgi:hypothetical protein
MPDVDEREFDGSETVEFRSPGVDDNNSDKHPAAAEASIVDLLKQDLQELTEHEDAYIPVAGYENAGLQIRYRLAESGKELDNIARRVAREYKDTYSRNLYTAVDTMVQLCMGLYVQPKDLTDQVVELDPNETGMPVLLDGHLADIFGWPGGETITSREVVRRLFGKNDLAVMAHAERLNRWLMNTKADLNAEIWQLGE